jgi:hypothetical protein
MPPLNLATYSNMSSDMGTRYSVTSLYYYVTPLFILADYVWGFNVRVAFLDAYPAYKGLYYGFCVACGVGVYAIPRCSPLVALFEGSINVVLAILALLLPYIRFLEHADEVVDGNFDTTMLLSAEPGINVLMAGFIAVLALKAIISQVTANPEARATHLKPKT